MSAMCTVTDLRPFLKPPHARDSPFVGSVRPGIASALCDRAPTSTFAAEATIIDSIAAPIASASLLSQQLPVGRAFQ
jgi:hypothetical protein